MKKVLVTGATGRTGSLVINKLEENPPKFEVVGLVRNEAKLKRDNFRYPTLLEPDACQCDRQKQISRPTPSVRANSQRRNSQGASVKRYGQNL